MYRLRSSVGAASKMMRTITASSISLPQPLRRFNISISPLQLNPVRPFAYHISSSRFFSTRDRSTEMSSSSDDEEHEHGDEIEDVSTAPESDSYAKRIQEAFDALEKIKKNNPDACFAEIKEHYETCFAEVKRLREAAKIEADPYAYYDEQFEWFEWDFLKWYPATEGLEKDPDVCYAEIKKIREDLDPYYAKIKSIKEESCDARMKRIDEDRDACFAEIKKIREDLDPYHTEICRIRKESSDAKDKRIEEEADARYEKIQRLEKKITACYQKISRIEKDPDPCSANIKKIEEDISACHQKIYRITKEGSSAVQYRIEQRKESAADDRRLKIYKKFEKIGVDRLSFYSGLGRYI